MFKNAFKTNKMLDKNCSTMDKTKKNVTLDETFINESNFIFENHCLRTLKKNKIYLALKFDLYLQHFDSSIMN